MKHVVGIEQCYIVKAVALGLLKVSSNTFSALSHGETGFMKPSLMKLVASCDTAFTCHFEHVFLRFTDSSKPSQFVN